MAMIEFPFSDVVGEAAASFQALAQTQGKEFQCDIQPMLSLNGNEKAIQQLVGILLDNALKYSPKNGMVSLKVWKQNRAVYLSVLNTTESPVQKDKLDLLFGAVLPHGYFPKFPDRRLWDWLVSGKGRLFPLIAAGYRQRQQRMACPCG